MLGLENCLQFYDVGAVESAKHCDLVEQDLPVDGILWVCCGRFRKGFDCESLPIAYPLDLIHCGVSSGIYFFDGSIESIEAILANIFCKMFNPNIQKRLICEIEVSMCSFLFDNSKPYFFAELSFFLR